jgi:hypothetical protein
MSEPENANERTIDTLKAKQQRFVDEYLRTGSATAAAQNAGYSARSASTLLAMEPIKAAIREAQTSVASEAGVTIASLISQAQDAYKAAESAGNTAGMVQATRLLAELTGLNEAAAPVPDGPEVHCTVSELARAILDVFREAGVGPDGPEIESEFRKLVPASADADPMESLNARDWPSPQAGVADATPVNDAASEPSTEQATTVVTDQEASRIRHIGAEHQAELDNIDFVKAQRESGVGTKPTLHVVRGHGWRRPT